MSVHDGFCFSIFVLILFSVPFILYFLKNLEDKKEERTVIEIKPNSKEAVLRNVLNALTQLHDEFPECKIQLEIPGNLVECELGDAKIYLTVDGKVAIDAKGD